MNIIPEALAAAEQTASQSHAAPGGSFIFMMVMFLVIFYFMLWRPQNKRVKEHNALLNSLAKGDEVVTNGGMLGKITKVNDDFIQLDIAENVSVTVQKSSVTTTLPKGTIKSQ